MTKVEIIEAFKQIKEIAEFANKHTKVKVNEYYDLITNRKLSYHYTKPGTYTKEAQKQDSEDGFQRELINSKVSTIDEELVNWTDIEIPVVYGKVARRNCLDLIGYVNGGKIVICELKYGGKGKNDCNPLMAGAQILFYYYMILENYSAFKLNNILHENAFNPDKINWDNVKNNIKLIVAANKSYWDYYSDKKWFQNKNQVLSKQSILNLFKEFNVSFYQVEKNMDGIFTWLEIQ